ncbi:ABC transporter permease [Acetivibrio ethanolgignens]|nr:ABC-2 family transporter protein [Acetivibrio ethanolgignens]
MEYRVNFLFSILAEGGWVCSHLLYLMVLYTSDISIGDIGRDSLYLFVGTYLVITGIYMSMFFTNFYNIPEYLRTGQLDLFITKPLSLQFIVTLRYVDFGYPITDFIVGIVLIVIGWGKMGIPISTVNILGFLGFIILGAVWVYVLQLLPALLSFWTVKVSGVYSIGYAVHDMNKMPRAVYGKLIQRIGTFIYPLFPMANYGTLFVTGKLTVVELIWGILGPVIFFAATKALWNVAVRKYVSASG